ncbi:hypothetical protein PUN28_011469 [Cardiocondyla obscurior]|uniref:Uncharacterized protein n=1 Tax=Cardiocondyla obscurior TaxID=286306 RepID=A0AAW2FGM8_9HYME
MPRSAGKHHIRQVCRANFAFGNLNLGERRGFLSPFPLADSRRAQVVVNGGKPSRRHSRGSEIRNCPRCASILNSVPRLHKHRKRPVNCALKLARAFTIDHPWPCGNISRNN